MQKLFFMWQASRPVHRACVGFGSIGCSGAEEFLEGVIMSESADQCWRCLLSQDGF